MDRYDLIIIGGGPAGYVPAIRAAQMGKRVAVLEEAEMGGTCLNRGCIPTKTLVSSAELLRNAGNARKFGLEGVLTFSWEMLRKRMETVVTRLRKGIESRLDGLGVETIAGHGELVGTGEVKVGGSIIRSDKVLLSPGSRPLRPGPFSAAGVLTSREVLSWSTLPESLIIVGGGVIGCEFASIFSALGVKVTVVELLPSILPGVDSDVKLVVERALKRAGVRLITGNGAGEVGIHPGKADVTLADGTCLSSERLLVSVGRSARVDDLGLGPAGVDFTAAGIRTDADQLTNIEGVYAAGDAAGKWQLAHAGSAQALAAVDHMFGEGKRKVDPDAMPGCIFTCPEIATVGPGQDEWEERGVPVVAGISRYIASGKAVGMNETEGFVKLIARKSDGVIVGVQMVGAHASSLVGEAVLAVNLGVRASDIGRMIHPHPTLAELFMEASEAFGEGSIHG
ncbi:MAG: dihydrolipoyl dehydrogenase [Candidatus Fermentibacteraceae bacterium]|nr:dihydrolipoyl dehydrogenase [Candidatus Fermentibacteraceae bacterium]MBN2609696.1 dihydrolipoyl dehydrogenase [Candidatus Fermentibacteraceae bacterium]